MVSVRAREDADLEDCVSVLRAVHDADRYPLHLPADPASFLVVPDAFGAWVALVDGDIAGHVVLRPAVHAKVMAIAADAARRPEEQLAVVGRLLVVPWARRRGVGRALLAHAVRAAWARDRRPILDVVEGNGGAAIALYEHEGWSRAGSLKVTFSSGETVNELVYVGPDVPAGTER